MYAELHDVYYNLMWNWLPESEKKRIEESASEAVPSQGSDHEEKDRMAFVEDVYRMRSDLIAAQADPLLETYWQNTSLERFLEAIAYWIEHRMPDMYERRGRRLPQRENWQDFYNLLNIGAIYE